MSSELLIATGIVLGLAVGLLIGRNARRERDEIIKKLECELIAKRNVVEAQNEIISRLRKKLKKKGYDADSDDN